jgi:hypothetical protein
VDFAGYGRRGNAEWGCLCDCGTRKTVAANELLRDKTTSCGCARVELTQQKKFAARNIIGRSFGGYLVLGYIGKSYWECKCDCGLICKVKTENLKTNKRGCKDCFTPTGNPGVTPDSFCDLTGSKVGRWTVVRRIVPTGKPFRSPRWLCRCDCGLEKSVSTMSLKSGDSSSCGCYRSEFFSDLHSTHGYTSIIKEHKGMTSKSGIALEYTIWNSAKSRARRDGLEFNIEPSDIVVPEKCPYLKCKLTPGIGKVCDTSPSLDRINPRLGYIKGNIQVISFRANTIKAGRTLSELQDELLSILAGIGGIYVQGISAVA